MTTRSALALLTALALALVAAVPSPAAAGGSGDTAHAAQKAKKTKKKRKSKKRSGGSIHNGNYTCYQGGLTSTGSVYWGYFKVTKGTRYAIVGSKGSFRRSGSKLIWKSGSLKKWKWKGRYRTSRTAAGERQYHVEIIDRPNAIKISCHDG